MLTQDQIQFYHDNGYLLVEDAVQSERRGELDGTDRGLAIRSTGDDLRRHWWGRAIDRSCLCPNSAGTRDRQEQTDKERTAQSAVEPRH